MTPCETFRMVAPASCANFSPRFGVETPQKCADGLNQRWARRKQKPGYDDRNEEFKNAGAGAPCRSEQPKAYRFQQRSDFDKR
jgi:hypothetical protein